LVQVVDELFNKSRLKRKWLHWKHPHPVHDVILGWIKNVKKID
jgi:hypothetical protein